MNLTANLKDLSMNNDPRKQIRNYCIMLDHLNGNTVSTQHQIKLVDDKNWHNSIPTYFIYSFFTFNTIYTIDWEQTYSTNQLSYSDLSSEIRKISSLIDYCFKSADRDSLSYFKSRVIGKYDEAFYYEALDYIEPDETELGNIQETVEDTNGFIHHPIDEMTQSFSRFIENSIPQKRDIKSIAIFIYLVRCNIFHGLKLICQLYDNPNEKTIREIHKLKAYTAFLNELNTFCIRQINISFSL